MLVNQPVEKAGMIQEKKIPLILFLFLFIGLLFVGNRINNDVWFLLNHGHYVDLYGFPHTEPFTIHEGLHFIMQQWLFAWILWKVYAFAGIFGLQAFAWIGGAVLIYLDYRLMLSVSRNRQMAFLLAQLIGLFCGILFICQRPQLFSSIIFLLEILVLENIPWGKKYCFVILSVLSALLINIHAAMWPMLFVFLLPYLAEWIGQQGRLARFTARFPEPAAWKGHELLILALGMFAFAFLNPYGTEAMTYTAHSYGYKEINAIVGEMTPLALRGFSSILLLLFIGLFMFYARHRAPLRYFLFAFGTGILALSSVRSLFLFLLFGTLPLAYMLQHKHLAYKQHYTFQRLVFLLSIGLISMVVYYIHYRSDILSFIQEQKIFLVVLLSLFVLLVFLIGRFFLGAKMHQCFLHRKELLPLEIERDGVLSAILMLLLVVIPLTISCYTSSTIRQPLQRASEVLYEEALPDAVYLYTGYDEGGYLEFKGFSCYIDPRAEVFVPKVNHKKNIFSEYYTLQAGKIDYRDFLSRYDFNYLLVDENDILYYNLANDEHYECIWDASEDPSISAHDIAEKNYRIFRKVD